MASIQHLVNAHPITTAQTIAQQGKTFKLPDNAVGITVEANFVYSGGGTSVKAFIQTSLDGGATWTDVMCFSYTTASGRKVLSVSDITPITTAVVPTTGTLTANTAVSGIVGDRIRAMVVTTGTYTGTNTLDLRMRIENS